MRTVELQLEPNEKYRTVIRGAPVTDDPVPDEDDYLEAHPAPDAADAYIETIESTPTAEDVGMDPDDLDVLTWSDISPASDPDVLAKIATYFDGMEPAEPSDRLEAKCRLLDVEMYADAQIAAQAELRDA